MKREEKDSSLCPPIRLDLPRLSVVTVCRNEAARIRQTAESVAGQTCQDFEWIVIDGGSTDGTVAILNEYQSQMTYLISEPDSGIYDAMNKGSRRATGSHLLFLNGGDRLADAEVVESLMPALAGDPDILMGDYCFEHLDGKCELRHSSRLPVTMHRLYRSSLPHCASLIRTALFREIVGEYDTSFQIMGDYDWFLRAILRHGAITVPVHRVFSVFNGEGISSRLKNSRILIEEQKRLDEEFYPRFYGCRWVANEVVGRLQSAWKRL